MAVEPLLATRAQRAFIITVSVQAIVVLVMVGITFRMVDDNVDFNLARYKTLPCYLALFALAEIFELFMAFDALRLRNIIQLLGLLPLMVFAALQVRQTKTALVMRSNCDGRDYFVECGGPGSLWTNVQPFLIVAPCVIAASWLVMLFWIKQLYAEFGWAIFHVVGANPKMKTMYQWYQIMICLLKFNFFCFTGVTMQLLIIVLQRDSAEFGVTVAAIPVVLVLLVLCGIAVQREIKWLMSISLVMMLAAMSYFPLTPAIAPMTTVLYKLVRFYQPSTQAQYETTRATLTVFTIVAFLLLFATFAVGLRCFADFDRGLQASKVNALPTRPKYFTAESSTNMSQRQSSYLGGAPVATRISIE
ncbi:hypothetical protein D9615_003942 [Tricholomella constricta]|uniref:Uncharacterized protein n=1 Tax=Tricholomella constricta TaxID=117010 RepID=A0A8H5M4V9_9AGAR|nr:hypothetical protein D9615_003942 [Tricholomella constricta]